MPFNGFIARVIVSGPYASSIVEVKIYPAFIGFQACVCVCVLYRFQRRGVVCGYGRLAGPSVPSVHPLPTQPFLKLGYLAFIDVMRFAILVF